MSPITRTKINISNLIAETQRIITNSNSNKISQFQNSEINSPKVDINFNKDNQFISDLYRSFSPKGPNIVSPQNESNNIIKTEIESSLRTLKSQGEDRNSQQIVDNLDEMENNNDKNNKMEQKKSGEIINNEKLITVKDIITGNKVENGNSNDLNNNNN